MSELEIKPTAGTRLRVFGIVAIAALLSVALIYLLIGRRGQLFAAKSEIYTEMPDATGVMEGTPVRLSGIEIGSVSQVNLTSSADPQRAVRVGMTVRTRYLRDIPIDSTTAIGALTLIGDKYIDINEGKSAAPLPADGVLKSEPVKQAADRADLIHAIADNLKQVDSLLATMLDPNTNVGRFVVDEQEYDTVLERVRQFDGAVRGFVSPESPLGQMLFTSKLYDEMHDDASRVDTALGTIQRGEGSAGHLYASSQQYDDLAREVRDLRDSLAKLSSGQGNMGALLESDAAYTRAVNALTRIDELLASAETGDGRMAELMRSPQLYEQLNGSLRDVEDFLRDFREHPEKYMRYRVFGKKKKHRGAAK